MPESIITQTRIAEQGKPRVINMGNDYGDVVVAIARRNGGVQ